MDILTLGLATGAPAEQTAPVQGEPGFAEALEQVQTGGLCPSLGPPGPEPPPDILLAEEGVEGLEPNALPEQPDFLPLPQVETDIDLPQPFWEEASATTQAETTTEPDSKPVEEAMEWLAGQMLGGFFAAPPVAITTETAPVEAPVATTPVAPASVPSTTQAYGAPQPELVAASEKTVEQTPVQQAPSEFEAAIAEATGVEAPKVLEALKPTISPEVRLTPEIEQDHDNQTGFIDEPAAVQTVSASQTLTVEENPLPSQDPLLQKKKPEAVTETEDSIKVEAHGMPRTAEKDAKITPTPEKVEGRPAAKVVVEAGEPTILEVAQAKPDADTKQGGNGNSQLRYQDGKGEGRETNVEVELVGMPEVESKGFTTFEGPALELNGSAPMKTAVVVDAKPEALKPAEVDSVVTQLTDKLHLLAAARPRNGVTIHLNPEDLGSITVMVKSIGRQVETQLLASDDRVRDALDQNRTRLVDAMDARGFNLHTVTVSQQSGHSTQQDSPRGWQSAQQHNQNPSDHPQGHTGQGGRSFAQPKAENVKGWVSKQEGVDLSI